MTLRKQQEKKDMLRKNRSEVFLKEEPQYNQIKYMKLELHI